MRRAALVVASAVLGVLWAAPPSHAAAVEGRVVDGCGRPVAGANLAVTRTRPSVPVALIGIRTNARGRYHYEPLEPAMTWITVRARGFRPQTKAVRVRAGRTSRLNFRFRRCAGGPALAG